MKFPDGFGSAVGMHIGSAASQISHSSEPETGRPVH